MKSLDLAKFIDHTMLKPNAIKEDIQRLCKEAVEYNFKGVCVNPYYVSLASLLLKGKKPIVIAAIGFPLGASQTSTKAFEAKEAIAAGAEEVDMVINIGALKEKEYQVVYEDILAVVNEVKPHLVKVILETGYLDRDEKIIACSLAVVAGASFVKTSTGFAGTDSSGKGATVEDIKLMKEIIGDKIKIKASGGIKNYEEAIKIIEAGADRIGSSSSVNLIKMV